MLLNIVKCKSKQGSNETFEVSFEGKNELLQEKGYTFLTPISVKGTMCYQNEELIVNMSVTFKIDAVCDNCGESFNKNISFDMEEKFVENFNSHNEEDYLIVQNSVEIDKPILDNLLLNLPTKMLCKENCKGLCQICGKNKNFYSCNCESLREELEKQENPFNQLKK